MKNLFLATFIVILTLSWAAFGQTNSKNELALQKVMAALEAKDLATVESFMAENAVLVHPMTFSGSTDNAEMRRFEGKKAVSGFVQSLFKDFKQLKFTDVSMFSTNKGNTVFVEMKSEFVVAANDASYKNVYVVKYDFANGKVVRIAEYFNPVPVGDLFKVRLGKQ
jgi:ketosteroid isomerase-like protein